MTTSTIRSPVADQQHPTESPASPGDVAWRSLYRVGGAAALLMVAFIPIQIVVFIVWPPPSTVIGFFQLFQGNWLLGLLSLDLLFVVDNALMIPLYLALYVAIRRASESLAAIALGFGLVGIAAYFPSNTAFEMLSLSHGYAAAPTDAERAPWLAAGQAMLAIYQGTAFDVYYVLNAIALLLVSAIMLRSTVFSRATALLGLLAGVFMVVPPTAGTLGLALSLASLVPWTIFAVLVTRRLFQLGQGATPSTIAGTGTSAVTAGQ
jgi:hypothetical protein